MKKCFNCGSKLEERHGKYRFEPPANVPGGTMIIDDATWFECENCGQQLIPSELSDQLERLSMKRKGLLMPEQIKAIREKLGLTQVEMAERLGVGEKTYTRWESGRSMQNKSSDNLIRLMDRSPEQFAAIEAQRDPERATLVSGYFQTINGHKGSNPFAIAAQDADLDPSDADRLREELRKAAKRKTE